MNIASYIDHTILSPVTTAADVQRLCAEAVQYQFAAVCVPPHYVSLAKASLESTTVKITTVIGFPFGYSSTASKIASIKKAIADGVDELDMVHNLCTLKNGDWEYLSQEMAACLQPVRLYDKVIKVILETGLLSDEALIKCCALYAKRKVDFVKTSTGYAPEGATVKAVSLLRKHLPETIHIKASGGIRTLAFARELIEAGAGRIGTSAGVNIVLSDEA